MNRWADTPKIIAKARCEGGESSPQYKFLNIVTPGPFILFFDIDRTDLTIESTDIIDSAVVAYSKGGPWNILVKGYTDGRASRDYSLALGERQANSVKAYLVSKGIPAERISIISYGKSRLSRTDRVGALENRKAEITFELNESSSAKAN